MTPADERKLVALLRAALEILDPTTKPADSPPPPRRSRRRARPKVTDVSRSAAKRIAAEKGIEIP